MYSPNLSLSSVLSRINVVVLILSFIFLLRHLRVKFAPFLYSREFQCLITHPVWTWNFLHLPFLILLSKVILLTILYLAKSLFCTQIAWPWWVFPAASSVTFMTDSSLEFPYGFLCYRKIECFPETPSKITNACHVFCYL